MELNNAMQIRLKMKEIGWSSEDRLSKMGWENGYGYSIWFERWNWHGVRIGKICIHAHTNDLNEIDKVTLEAAKKCIQAWKDFTESVPWQVADGSLEENPIQTPYYQKALKENKKLNKEDRNELFDKLRDEIISKKSKF